MLADASVSAFSCVAFFRVEDDSSSTEAIINFTTGVEYCVQRSPLPTAVDFLHKNVFCEQLRIFYYSLVSVVAPKILWRHLEGWINRIFRKRSIENRAKGCILNRVKCFGKKIRSGCENEAIETTSKTCAQKFAGLLGIVDGAALTKQNRRSRGWLRYQRSVLRRFKYRDGLFRSVFH